ncbi:pyridoxamine 5'-phosphate oxidase family protein [Kutzneria sp. 744]|uniref:pyridoxamine 5'-phosphate oxidase family protein n=1 Tax=Kutzneria sp. (strain 744) TaxID=345341 RepID=UPI0003EEAE77|nr:PPOX class F420-dependent oxidoreductase [Kutzneria sp. 744]EWM18029.1 PPOX class F420-dependent enzyme [Kutzneria sp. 744]
MSELSSTGAAFAEFWRERHLCTLTTVRPDSTPHVVPVGVTLDIDNGLALVITDGNSAKARQLRAAGRLNAAACQVDGRRWSTVEGVATLNEDPQAIAEAVSRYAQRYRQPRVNPNRVLIEIAVTNVLGNVS